MNIRMLNGKPQNIREAMDQLGKNLSESENKNNDGNVRRGFFKFGNLSISYRKNDIEQHK